MIHKDILKNSQREVTLILALVGIVILFACINPIYVTFSNIRDIIDQATIYGLMSIGMTFVIITGGIDLSVGSTLALVAVVAASMACADVNVVIVIVVALLFSALLGFANGFLVAKMQLQPFIATMGTMSVFRGAAYIMTGGFPVTGVASGFRKALYGELFWGVRVSILVLALFAIISHLILKYTRFGNYVYAIGGNEEATRLSGVKVDRNKMKAYMLCSVGTGLASLVLIAKLASGEPTAGQGYETEAIAAACIGGTSMAGGKGKIPGTFLGAVLFSALRVGLITSGVDTFWQYVASGLVIIIAAYTEILQSQLARASKKKAKTHA